MDAELPLDEVLEDKLEYSKADALDGRADLFERFAPNRRVRRGVKKLIAVPSDEQRDSAGALIAGICTFLSPEEASLPK